MSHDLQQPMIVQQFVPGDEIEVPVLEMGATRLAIPVMVLHEDGSRLKGSFLSYDEVWRDSYRYGEPSALDTTARARVANVASTVSRLLNFRGFSRVDFRIDEHGREFVIDVSTTPHLTKGSSYAHIFDALTHGYDGLMAALVGSGMARHALI
jgi:D-alanine-D-alanine ligase